jgi:hypothetical protein
MRALVSPVFIPSFKHIVSGACLAALLLTLTATGLGQEVPKPIPDIVDESGKAVGVVATLDKKGNYKERLGCFFVNANGVLVTVYQPIAEADGVEVILPDGRKTRDVSIVSVDPRKDIAILKVAAEGVPTVALADSDKARVGQEVIVLARPLATFVSANNAIISTIRDSKRGLKLHQLSIPVDRTTAGCPAVNRQGEVMGLVSFYSLFNERLGFTVPINYVRGQLSDEPSMTFAEFLSVRKPFQPFDPATLEAKRLEILDKVRVTGFQMRDTRVKWEQVQEVTGKLRAELFRQLNLYGATRSQILLSDPFDVAEHRTLIANLWFNFGEVFAVKDAAPGVLFPLAPGMMSSASPTVFPLDDNLYGKKGEAKGKISKVVVSYNLVTYLPLFMSAATPGVVNPAAMEVAALLSRLGSAEEMPDLSCAVYYKDQQGKEEEAQSIWSYDAYTMRWEDIRDKKLWDLQEKLRIWKQTDVGSGGAQ